MPVRVTMPQLSPTMETGTLARWLVSEGDSVTSGDVLAEIETDKATMEVETVDEGRVARLLLPAGTENIPVNETIAVILEDGEDEADIEAFIVAAGTVVSAAPVDTPQSDDSAPRQEQRELTETTMPGERVRASPLARNLARQNGIDLSSVRGTGPHGRVVRRDIEHALKTGPAVLPVELPVQPLPAAYEDVPVTAMRRIIAERLQEAKQTIPHFYLTVDCRIDRLLAIRADANENRDANRISVNDFVIKALAAALASVPDANAQWAGDRIRRFRDVDVAVAVAVPGGLVTPVIRSAQDRSVGQISALMRDLASRARDGKLMPEEYQGGSFSLSNLGMYGIRQFDAVINPPQAGILAVGSGERRPIVNDDGVIEPATVMTCTLSCDHRVIDGAIGAQLLGAFKRSIESPVTLLVG